jgi:hypothetical protein
VVTPTPVDTPTPTPVITPTPVPTPPADAGFQWCSPACTNFGFLVEYPATWQGGGAANAPGVQYVNPAAADEIASFKAPGPASGSASDLVTSDLQTNFQTQPGYTPPTTSNATTISGVTWIVQTASYQNSAQQQIAVQVYGTVYQQKAYLIELQAINGQFQTVTQQYFAPMLKSYSFQTVPTA